MIFNSREYVERDLKFQKRKLQEYKREIVKLPDGLLSASERNGKRYFTRIQKVRGRRVTQYLGDATHPEVQVLQKKYFLEKSIKIIKENIGLMEGFLDKYGSIDPNLLEKQFPKAYQALPETCFDAAGVFDLESWGNMPYIKSAGHPENLTHITAKGDKVRSKSEVIIANALRARRLSYRYEEKTKINGYTKAPDFKILDPRTNQIVYWEHCGMMSDYEYFKGAFQRVRDYIQQGIIPGVNLILTFDDVDGNIDSLMIERTIDLWFGLVESY